MVRAQIMLREDQHRTLKETSKTSGESISALVRKALDQMTELGERMEARRAAIAFLGSVRADANDIAENHDKYLGEIDWRD